MQGLVAWIDVDPDQLANSLFIGVFGAVDRGTVASDSKPGKAGKSPVKKATRKAGK